MRTGDAYSDALSLSDHRRQIVSLLENAKETYLSVLIVFFLFRFKPAYTIRQAKVRLGFIYMVRLCRHCL